MGLLLRLIVLAAIGLGSAGCTQPPASEGAPVVDLQKIATKRIFFGHQSVGWNILQGVEELLAAEPEAKLTLTQLERVEADLASGFIHMEIGQNYDPLSKLQAFKQAMEAGVGLQADIAFFKFCYVDIDKNTDPGQLFASYQQVMDELSKAYPQTRLVYVTTPLMAPEQGVKAMLKGLLGRNDAALANLKRHEFNELLRLRYAESGRVFDLAAIEATAPDGKRCTVTVDGVITPCMVSAYSDDGGHLNAVGRQVVAGQFLQFLVSLE
jgi:hypothetical protein